MPFAGALGPTGPSDEKVLTQFVDQVAQGGVHLARLTPINQSAPASRYAARMARRDEIAQRAVELFAISGFHGVSVADIGAACGISGPALYKHFASKQQVLAHALAEISTELLRTGRARAEAAPDADARLDALIAWHLDFAVRQPAYIVVQEREWVRLDAETRAEVRRTQLAYIDLWVDAVAALRSDLDRAEARSAVQATFGLLNSTPHSARISEDRLRARLTTMARAALVN